MMPNTSPLPPSHAEPDPASDAPKPWPTQLLTWLPIIIGLAVLYVPSLYDLFTGIWSSDEQIEFADMVLFFSALMLIIGVDTAMQKFDSFRHTQA